MKKLSFIFTTIVANLSGVAFLNNISEAKTISTGNNKIKNYMEGYSNKQSLFKLKFKTVIIDDFEGIEAGEITNKVFLNIIKNDLQNKEFILKVLEETKKFKITGNNFVIPLENESKTYNLRITAVSTNSLYSGTTKIKVILMNKKNINIEEYNKLFSAKIGQLTLKAIGYSNNPKHWERDMLLELDKQLIEQNADMHGFDGKNGHETLFIHAFENDLIEIEFGKPENVDLLEKYENVTIKSKTIENDNYVLKPYKELKIKVGVIVRKSIDISDSSFINYFKTSLAFDICVDASEEEWKKTILYETDKRVQSLEEKIGQPNFFVKNINFVKIKYANKNLWDGNYELYDLEITTPDFILDQFLPNKTLKLIVKVNRIYSDFDKEIGYFYQDKIQTDWSKYQENEQIKEHVICDLNNNFKNLDGFQKNIKK